MCQSVLEATRVTQPTTPPCHLAQVVAFVKGTRTSPQCGFSYKVLTLLNEVGWRGGMGSRCSVKGAVMGRWLHQRSYWSGDVRCAVLTCPWDDEPRPPSSWPPLILLPPAGQGRL